MRKAKELVSKLYINKLINEYNYVKEKMALEYSVSFGREKKSDEYRIEYPDYPERSIQEALVNALIHRDYSEIGSEVHIDMYDDRLEIYSPGGMIDGTLIQDQNPYYISSKRRNPIIADIFSRMNLMERRGSGLKKILDNYEAQEKYSDKYKPQFNSTESSFYIILKNLNYKTAIKNGDKKTAIKSKQKEIIIDFAIKNENFKAKDIEELLNLKSSRTRLLISELVADNIIVPIGEYKNRRYILKNKN